MLRNERIDEPATQQEDPSGVSAGGALLFGLPEENLEDLLLRGYYYGLKLIGSPALLLDGMDVEDFVSQGLLKLMTAQRKATDDLLSSLLSTIRSDINHARTRAQRESREDVYETLERYSNLVDEDNRSDTLPSMARSVGKDEDTLQLASYWCASDSKNSKEAALALGWPVSKVYTVTRRMKRALARMGLGALKPEPPEQVVTLAI